jgi:DNA-binding LacI/PurR family transcriptional regulator
MSRQPPSYARLPQQVADSIQSEILRGTWTEILPGERQLAKSLQVSRRTVRAAIEILRRRKILGTVHGLGTSVLARRSARAVRNPWPTIGLLLPEDIGQLRPQTAVFIDHLRSFLYARGLRLDTHAGQHFFSKRPAIALKKLVGQFPHTAWILALSTEANQKWFRDQSLPVVVVGTPHQGIDLPHVDIDMGAVGRHASGHLLRKGHRHIALFIEDTDNAGDRETEKGFLEGVRGFRHSAARVSVIRHEGSLESIRRKIERLKPGRCPTALFISNPYHYLATASLLAQKGIRVPADISLLCRDDDLFLSFLATKPSRYVCDAQTRAKITFSTLMRVLEGRRGATPSTRMLPDFVEGASIATLLKGAR